MSKEKSKLKIIPLGGLDGIGKNITVLEYNNDLIIVDCGISFPEDDMPGVDIVLPDIEYIKKNENKVRGMVITHGHEDHYGAVPYVLKEKTMPVYGTRLTLGLLKNKFKEHNLSSKPLREVKAGDKVKLGSFEVEFIAVTHSIPDACALAISTPVGKVIFTGDFKIDTNPIDGRKMDLGRLAELGNEGVLALFADSTNVEKEGFSKGERTVGDTFQDLFLKSKGRIIVASFASNLHRVQQVISTAEEFGRKVALSGRSMINNVEVAVELGYLKVKKDTIINVNDVNKFPANKTVILTTGSQGEPMAALSRMARGDHRQIKLIPGDTVLISATPIPGNEKTVSDVLNNLMEIGVDVIYSAIADVHVSGHAYREELKLMHMLTKPKFFIPAHGERRHLRIHAKLAEELGMDPKNIVVATNGDVIKLSPKSIYIGGKVDSGEVFVDGKGVGDVGNIVLRDRTHLSEHGLMVVIITMDKKSGELVAGPNLISRGFVYVKESQELMDECKRVCLRTLERCKDEKIFDWSSIKYHLRSDLRSFLFHETKRNPMILPIIIEV